MKEETDRELSEEAQNILNRANNLFKVPRYEIHWARHVDSDNNIFDAWVIFDKEWDNICDSHPYDDQDCISTAKMALKFAEKESKNG